MTGAKIAMKSWKLPLRGLPGKPELTPGFVDDERHCIGQVDAAAECPHGNEHGRFAPDPVEHGLRKSASLRPE